MNESVNLQSIRLSGGLEFQQIYDFSSIFYLHTDPKIKKSSLPNLHLFS